MNPENNQIKILFVCMGNICRSPTAEGVFAKLLQDKNQHHRFHLDSAGTHAYHLGEAPDQRAQQAAMKRGINLGQLRARQVNKQDFVQFDYIIAMDRQNYDQLLAVSPTQYQHKIQLFLDFAPELQDTDVPDPYYGGKDGFEQVLNLCEAAALGLLNTINQTLRQ